MFDNLFHQILTGKSSTSIPDALDLDGSLREADEEVKEIQRMRELVIRTFGSNDLDVINGIKDKDGHYKDEDPYWYIPEAFEGRDE